MSDIVKDFHDGLASGKLLIQVCNACKTKMLYPRHRCISCHSNDLGWTQERATKVPLREDVRLPDRVWRLMSERHRALAALEAAALEVERTTNDLVRRLVRDDGRSLRDVASLLGLSHGRIHQVLLGGQRPKGVRKDRRSAANRGRPSPALRKGTTSS